MGWSPIRRVKETISDVGSAIDDAIIAPIVDPIVEAGRQFEDRVRDGVEGIDEAIQNPYVRMVVGAVAGPQAKAVLDAYAKLDSGEELDTADYVALGISGAEELGDVEISPELKTGIEVGTRLNAGEDPVDIYIDEYGEDYVEKLDLDTKLDTTLRDYYGDEVADILKDNKNLVQLATDIVVNGEDPSAAIAKYYGQDIVDYLDLGDATGYAALKTAVALDQGLDTKDAVLSGAEEYYRRGGKLPDAGQIAELAGIEELPDFDLNQFVSDLGIDFPELNVQGYTLPQLADLNIDVGQFNLSGFSPKDLGYDVGTWGELRDLGVDIGELDLSEYNLPELADLNLDLNIPELNIALRKYGQQPSELASLEMDKELTGEEDPFADLTEPEITRISRQLVGNIS